MTASSPSLQEQAPEPTKAEPPLKVDSSDVVTGALAIETTPSTATVNNKPRTAVVVRPPAPPAAAKKPIALTTKKGR